MSQGKYPIQKFLRRLIPPFESCRDEFVEKLGYRNLEPGRLHLDAWVNRGEGYAAFLHEIAAAYPDHAAELEMALAETAALRAAEGDTGWRERCREEEASWVPFIHVEGERSVPNGITIFGLTGGHRRWTTIQISPKILKLPVTEQLAALPELMRAYLEEYRGECPFFGMVRSFVYVRLRGYCRFGQDCYLIEHVQGQYRRGHVEVSLR